MADATPKRELPARERRQSFKLQESSPSAPTKAPDSVAPTPAPSTATSDSQPRVKRKYTRRAPLIRRSPDRRNSTPASEDSIPARLINSKPLPTTQNKPEPDLSLRQYQSIAESAILAASLHRSRVQWLCEGIFKRYWTKPSKRKGAPEIAADNPEQKSMQKLGVCQITIDPHVFDAVVYTVRETHVLPPPQYYPPRPPPTQQPPPFYNSPVAPNAAPQTLNSKTSTPAPETPSSPFHFKPEPNSKTAPVLRGGDLANAPDTPISRPFSSPKKRNSQDQNTPAPPKPNADPVIQMLAARAATDPNLKELMKVVATSKASPAQLKEFQSHIDEFNAIIKRDAQREGDRVQAMTPAPVGKTLPQIDGPAETPSKSDTTGRPSGFAAAHPSTYSSPAPGPGGTPLQQAGKAGTPSPASPHPQYAYYPPPPRPEPYIKHIVVELTSPATASQAASQDRWLFPEYAVLDTPHSGRGLEMVCSFFVERRGTQIIAMQGGQSGDGAKQTSFKWRPELDYYQPVTMVLRAQQHRTLETIARAAKPLVEVQNYMVEVMKKKTRAPIEYLALQLPRDRVEEDIQTTEFADSAIELSEDDELKDYYGT